MKLQILLREQLHFGMYMLIYVTFSSHCLPPYALGRGQQMSADVQESCQAIVTRVTWQILRGLPINLFIYVIPLAIPRLRYRLICATTLAHQSKF